MPDSLKRKDPPVRNFDRKNIDRMQEFFLVHYNLNLSMVANGFSIVGSVKPQIENTDNENNINES